MYKQFKHLSSIRFPVYPLRSKDWYRQDGLLFDSEGRVLDDTNMPGGSLGARRAQSGQNMAPLRRACPDVAAMITSKKTIFIDSNGVPFIYKRSVGCHLKFYPIKAIEPKDTCSIVKLRGVPYPFMIERPPIDEARFAGVLLYDGAPWFILEFSKHRGKDSFRRV